MGCLIWSEMSDSGSKTIGMGITKTLRRTEVHGSTNHEASTGLSAVRISCSTTRFTCVYSIVFSGHRRPIGTRLLVSVALGRSDGAAIVASREVGVIRRHKDFRGSVSVARYTDRIDMRYWIEVAENGIVQLGGSLDGYYGWIPTADERSVKMPASPDLVNAGIKWSNVQELLGLSRQ